MGIAPTGTSRTRMATAIATMAEPAAGEAGALYRLLAWLSPGYPVGAFSYSHGLESALEAGLVTDAATLTAWLDDILRFGTGRSDGILLAAAWRAARAGDGAALAEIAELAAAFQPAAELALESTAQGRAFAMVTAASWPCTALGQLDAAWSGPLAYPVAVGVAAAGHGIPLATALPAYLHGFVANLVSAGVRLIPLGQTDGQRAIAGLEGAVHAVAQAAAAAELDELAGNTFRNDWCAMRHETQHTRLFRS
jgi:urease accessory protein